MYIYVYAFYFFGLLTKDFAFGPNLAFGHILLMTYAIHMYAFYFFGREGGTANGGCRGEIEDWIVRGKRSEEPRRKASYLHILEGWGYR